MNDEIPQGGEPEAVATYSAPETPSIPAVAPEPKVSLAATIREAREARERAAAKTKAANDLSAENENLRKQVATLQADPMSDLKGWVEAKKLTKAEQATLGKALLYDLVPDKMPTEERLAFLERKQERDKRLAEERKVAEQDQARRHYEAQQLNSYASAVKQAAVSFATGSHPESEAWFGDDGESYAKSLLATAQNMAQMAHKSGKQANLDPGHVASILEADIATRMKARDSRRGKNVSTTDVEGAKGSASTSGVQSAGKTTSTKGLGTGGPRSPAQTDKERIDRAIAAAFGAPKSVG